MLLALGVAVVLTTLLTLGRVLDSALRNKLLALDSQPAPRQIGGHRTRHIGGRGRDWPCTDTFLAQEEKASYDN
jgi:hypothetical protein